MLQTQKPSSAATARCRSSSVMKDISRGSGAAARAVATCQRSAPFRYPTSRTVSISGPSGRSGKIQSDLFTTCRRRVGNRIFPCQCGCAVPLPGDSTTTTSPEGRQGASGHAASAPSSQPKTMAARTQTCPRTRRSHSRSSRKRWSAPWSARPRAQVGKGPAWRRAEITIPRRFKVIEVLFERLLLSPRWGGSRLPVSRGRRYARCVPRGRVG